MLNPLRGFARSGAGVSMLHYLSFNRDVKSGVVVAIPFRDDAFHKSVVEICTQKRSRLPAAVEGFTDHFISTFTVPPDAKTYA